MNEELIDINELESDEELTEENKNELSVLEQFGF